ncbi:sulfotransferase [Arthrobacter castelli]|uniref:sulfotransferase n=1 Tax=Arthrobacter castelli TaxID=271431 RepID=UPI00047C228B|nr:sulfotransferase domain-containing protein [Arthrobacter castelli]
MTSLPDFLVIGAQKCGTTTLYEDLRSHPRVFIPDKETSGLVDLKLDDASSVEKYCSMFEQGGSRLSGEVSTLYSMLPMYDVARTAGRLLGAAQILYIVREPISRVISHHHHEFSAGAMGPDIDVEVEQRPELVDNSRYATQVAPWIDAFGRSNVHIIRFEDYMADRQAGADGVFRKLGLDQWKLPTASEAFNTADNKFLATGLRGKVSRSTPYRRLIRPLFPEAVRRRLMRLVLPKPPKRPNPPSEDTVAELVRRLQPEVVALSEWTGGELWWDLNTVLENHRG